MQTATHHIGSARPTVVERGKNTGSKTIAVGMVVYQEGSGATDATKKYGTDSVSACWAPASDAGAADLEHRKWGVAKTAAAVGAEFEVYVSGEMIPCLMETTSGETSILAGAPLMIDHADDEVISRAFAVTKTGLGQPIRFQSSITQTTTASADNTIKVDLFEFPIGQFSGS